MWRHLSKHVVQDRRVLYHQARRQSTTSTTILGPQGSSIVFSSGTIVVSRSTPESPTVAGAAATSVGGWPVCVQVISDAHRIGEAALSIARPVANDALGLTNNLVRPQGVLGNVVEIDGTPVTSLNIQTQEEMCVKLNHARSFMLSRERDASLPIHTATAAAEARAAATSRHSSDDGEHFTNEDNFPVIFNVMLMDPSATATAPVETTTGMAASTTVSAHMKGHKGPPRISFTLRNTPSLVESLSFVWNSTHKKVLTLRNLRQSDAQRIEELVGFRVRGIRILFSRATNAEELFHGQQRRRTFIGVPLRRKGRRSLLHTATETPQSSSAAPCTHETKVN